MARVYNFYGGDRNEPSQQRKILAGVSESVNFSDSKKLLNLGRKMEMSALKTLWIVLVVVTLPAFAQTAVNPEQRAAIKELLSIKQRMGQETDMWSLQFLGLNILDSKRSTEEEAHVEKQKLLKKLDILLESPAGGKLTPEKIFEIRSMASEVENDAIKDILKIYNDPQVVQEIEDIMVQIYEKYFSTDEIKAIIAFYKNSVGKKVLTIMPQIERESASKIMAKIQSKIPEIYEKKRSVIGDMLREAEKGTKQKN